MKVALSASLVVLLSALWITWSWYKTRDVYSADEYYVRINTGSRCSIVRTDYRDSIGLAPLILDNNCTRDIRNLHKGDFPQLEASR